MKTDSTSKFNNDVDFRNCSIDIIDILFPKKKHRGSLNPLILEEFLVAISLTLDL